MEIKTNSLKSGLTIEVASSSEELLHFSNTWKDFFAAHGQNVFQSFEWNFAWLNTIGAGVLPQVLFASRDQSLQAIVPLMITRTNETDSEDPVLSFLTSPDADQEPFLTVSITAAAEAIAEYCAAQRKSWSKVDLFPFEKQETFDCLITKLKQQGIRLIYGKHGELALDTITNDATGLPRTSVALDSALRRKLSRLAKAGKVDLRLLGTAEEIKKELPFFFQSHIHRWRDTEHNSKFCSKSYREFYAALTNQLSASGEVKLIVFYAGTHATAYYFAFFLDREVALYTPAYEIYFKRDSPGRLLLHAATMELRRKGYSTINHLYGAEAYKREFCNKYVPTYRAIGFARLSGSIHFRLRKRLISYLGEFHRLVSKLAPSPISKLRVMIIKEGYWVTVKHLFRKLLSKFYYHRSLLIFVYDQNERKGVAELPNGMSIQELREEDMPKIAHIHGFAMGDDKHKVVLERFHAGARCFAIAEKEYLASICWAVFDQDYLYDVESYYKLGKGEVMLVDAVTPEIYRGKGLYPMLLGHLASHFAEMGYPVLGNCLPTNTASLKGIGRVGFKQTSRIRLAKCLGKRLG